MKADPDKFLRHFTEKFILGIYLLFSFKIEAMY